VLLRPELTGWHQVAAMKPSHYGIAALRGSVEPVIRPKIAASCLTHCRPSRQWSGTSTSRTRAWAIMARVSSHHVRLVSRAPGAAPAAPGCKRKPTARPKSTRNTKKHHDEDEEEDDDEEDGEDNGELSADDDDVHGAAGELAAY